MVKECSMNKCNRLFLILALAIIPLPAIAQSSEDCSQGLIKNQGKINGEFEICPPLKAQAPALAGQLADITKTLGTEQAALKEIRQLIRNLNSVSQNIGPQRQGELLRNLSSQLAVSQQGGKAKTKQEISSLADGFDAVEDKLVGMLTDKTTADRTNAAVDGPVGDAIAKLDFSSAQNQLDDIRQQLKAIHAEVGEVNQTTKETNERTKAIQKTIDDAVSTNAQMQQQGMEQVKKMREQQQNNPAGFAIVHFITSRQLSRGANRTLTFSDWNIQAIVTSPHMNDPLQDANLEIVFHAAGKKDWTVEFPARPVVSYSETLAQRAPDLGQQATVCFTARDPQRDQRLRWRQSFTLEADSTHTQYPGMGNQPMMMTFVPAGLATLTPVTNEPCQ
jgi:hypothetical protein